MLVSTSNAYAAFERNRSDVDRLMELHGQIGGEGAGRRYGVAVLNKSAIVLLCASWEAYCEDLVSEVVKHYVDHSPDPNSLPQRLRKQIAAELHGDQMKMWMLAGDGWRRVLTDRLDDLKVERDRALNTPKTAQIRALFREHAGCDDITDGWHWSNRTKDSACDTLDSFVSLRGDIAHRVEADFAVHKGNVTYYSRFVGKLVEHCDHTMTELAADVTGVDLVSA